MLGLRLGAQAEDDVIDPQLDFPCNTYTKPVIIAKFHTKQEPWAAPMKGQSLGVEIVFSENWFKQLSAATMEIIYLQVYFK